MDIVLIMLKDSWRDNIDLFIRMHSILFDSDIPSPRKKEVVSFIPGHPLIFGEQGEYLFPPFFSIMFK